MQALKRLKSGDNFLLVWLLVVTFCGCEALRPNRATVIGRVLHGKRPVAGVKVSLEEFSFYRSFATLTDVDGEFVFSNVVYGHIPRGRLIIETARRYINLADTVLVIYDEQKK